MRIVSLVLIITVAQAAPTLGQASADAWEFGVGPHVARRDDSTVHHGGGITIGRRWQPVSAVLEASGTRRHGHNDWRVVAGPRVALTRDSQPTLFAQVLGGVLIRQRAADWAVLPGVGIDIRITRGMDARLQVDAPIERSDAQTATSARGAIWLVFH